MLALDCLIFAVSLAVLVKSSDYFIDASENLGKWLGIPTFVIGVTIIALGTSLPELIISIMAVNVGQTKIVLGNVVGSNVSNILLILGVSGLLANRMEIEWNIFLSDLPMFFASGLLFCFVVWPNQTPTEVNYVTLNESILLICGGLIYVWFSLSSPEKSEEPSDKSKTKKRRPVKSKSAKSKKENSAPFPVSAPLIIVGAAVGIYLGATYTIDSLINVSKALNIAEDLVAISAVAIGTSLPELIVSIAAVRKQKFDMAFGNVAGSNIFNVFAVVGIPGVYANMSKGYGLEITSTISGFAMPFMVFTYVLFLVVMMDKKITRMEGMILLLCYVLFMGKLFVPSF